MQQGLPPACQIGAVCFGLSGRVLFLLIIKRLLPLVVGNLRLLLLVLELPLGQAVFKELLLLGNQLILHPHLLLIEGGGQLAVIAGLCLRNGSVIIGFRIGFLQFQIGIYIGFFCV